MQYLVETFTSSNRSEIMKRVLLFTILFLLAQCEDHGVEVIGEEDGVLVLDESNFRDALKTYPLLMVEFYAPW